MLQQQIQDSRRQTLVALIGLVVLAGLLVRWEPWAAVPSAATISGVDEVLVRLPPANSDPQLRRAAQETLVIYRPAEALALAARYLATIRSNGDSQLGGFAESLLLGERVRAMPRAMLLLADLYQFQHRFSESESLLSRLRASNEGGSQTWLLSANLARVQGRLGDAMDACINAGRPAPTAWSVLCAGDLAILNGDSGAYQSGLRSLNGLADRRWSQDPVAAVWLGDMADRAGFESEAGQHFRRALVLGPGPYGVDRYFRFLVEHQKIDAAERLLKWWLPQRRDPSMPDLLNQAQVAAIRGDRSRLASLRREFNDMRRRSRGAVHWRELTRFSLLVEQDSQGALHHASENWRHQKEPIDAVLLARAAGLAGSQETLNALSDELNRTRMFGVLTQLQKQGLL